MVECPLCMDAANVFAKITRTEEGAKVTEFIRFFDIPPRDIEVGRIEYWFCIKHRLMLVPLECPAFGAL